MSESGVSDGTAVTGAPTGDARVSIGCWGNEEVELAAVRDWAVSAVAAGLRQGFALRGCLCFFLFSLQCNRSQQKEQDSKPASSPHVQPL